MNVIVCVKQIPDPAVPGALDGSTNTLKRDGKLILDDSDAYGVEMALQLVDKAGGGEVSLVSMAPNGETSGLRTALAMGAAKGVLVSDPALQGSDALTTAKVLAAAIQKLGGADLIIAVDISAIPEGQSTKGAVDILLQTFNIMGHTISQYELGDADVVVRPKLQGVGSADFGARRLSILAGREAMLTVLPQLRERIAARAR